ncbi:hypothetical protein WMY93_000932 [Mugilogobius chulae]|uniref:Platelet-activating factor receptor n=1 Tax=Mugilogobius chulae TaxID=88201 RepID=A0AAW0Q0N5_9GOBI
MIAVSQSVQTESAAADTMLPSTPLTTEIPAVTFLPSGNSSFLDSEFRYALFPPVYGLIFILGLFANIYVLFVIRCLREARAMGEIRIYMTNLTIGRLALRDRAAILIDYYCRHGNWNIFRLHVPSYRISVFVNTYSSVLFLGAISVNRYWAVARPLDAVSSDRRRRGIVVCSIIWLAVVAMSIPYLLSQERTRIPMARHVASKDIKIKRFAKESDKIRDNSFHKVYENFIQRKATQRCQAKSHTDVAGSRWRVHTLLPSPSRGPRSVGVSGLQIQDGFGHVDWSQDTLQKLNDAHQVTLVIMGLNCIMDPVVYFFATRKFRRFIMAHLKRFAKGEGCSHTATSQISMDSKHQVQLKEMDELDSMWNNCYILPLYFYL